ncbi:MAG: sugar phosphate isomerase/epimerase [Saprospiraceae bacterium]|nr:sugar phosphate isomerase/epimerase [Saprospiraceae bacterium]
MTYKRRDFIKLTGAAGIGLTVANPRLFSEIPAPSKMKFGLVTYQWGKDWDLATVIKNCEDTGYEGVELRTEHAHGVETTLSSSERKRVKKMFSHSSVTCVGYGSNFEYHNSDQTKLRWNIDQTKEYVKLCHDIGATGLKVKPNTLPADIPREKTISQIASSLNEVGKFAQNYDQLIRVEAHGHLTSELPNMKAIFDQVTEPNVKICWNCNPVDTNPPGIKGNFESVQQWIGDTVHVHTLNKGDYPYQEVLGLLGGIDYAGWILLEEGAVPTDIVTSMKEQKVVFNELMSKQ